MTMLRDETGSVSSARVGFWVWTAFTIALIGGVALNRLTDPGNAVWSLVGGVFIALIGWAGGPRMMAHLAPTIGAFAKSVGDARIAERRKQGGDYEPT